MNIMKFRPLYLILSSLLILVSLFSIVRWGFRPSIDFVGGTVWDFSLPTGVEKTKVESVFSSANIPLSSISQANQNQYSTKFQSIGQDKKIELETAIKALDKDYSELRYESLGPSIGRELLQKTVVAIVLSSIMLLFFIGSRFQDFSFGASAILAMFHDSIILIGAFSLLGHLLGAELDSLFVTALLTTLSASVHDTVITFDRIRELKHRNFRFEWTDLANQAVTEVIVRSINNSMTVIIMLLSLVVLGGETTKWFALALLIGVICGTYSSFGVAIPMVLFWKKRSLSNRK